MMPHAELDQQSDFPGNWSAEQFLWEAKCMTAVTRAETELLTFILRVKLERALQIKSVQPGNAQFSTGKSVFDLRK